MCFLDTRAEIPHRGCVHGAECQQLTGCVGTAGSADQHCRCKPSQERRDGELLLLGMVIHHRASATCSDVP